MKLTRIKRVFGVGVLMTGVFVWSGISSGLAVSSTVRQVATTGSDTGDCTTSPCKTIGYAIVQSASGDTVEVAAGTYPELITVDRSLTISGAGADETVIDGQALGTVVTIGKTSSSLDVTISSLTVTDGLAAKGGGIASIPRSHRSNEITLVHLRVTANRVAGRDATVSDPAGDALGGGIFNGRRSTLTLLRSIVDDNSAVGGKGLLDVSGGGDASGGGIFVARGDVVSLSHSSLIANQVTGGEGGSSTYYFPNSGGDARGGGIFNAGSSSLAATTFASDVATGGVGGRAQVRFGGCDDGGPGGMAVGGGVANTGSLLLDRSVVVASLSKGGDGGHGGNNTYYGCAGGDGGDGRGGAIDGEATVINSTIVSDKATGGSAGPSGCGSVGCGPAEGSAGDAFGGGIAAGSADLVINSTLSGNDAIADGDGGPGTASGGGVYLSGSVTFANTILAGNSAASGPDCSGPANSLGHNLLGSDAGCTGFTGSGDLVNVDPLLGPLQDNGGPTYTMALQPGSPAISAAKDSVCASAPVHGVDQRGMVRKPDPHCDIGAFEVQP